MLKENVKPNSQKARLEGFVRQKTKTVSVRRKISSQCAYTMTYQTKIPGVRRDNSDNKCLCAII